MAKRSIREPARGSVRTASRRRAESAPAADSGRHPLFRVSLAVSLDGYIASPDGGVKWLDPFFTPEIDFGGFMRTIGITVWGRKTFDLALNMGTALADGGPAVVLTHRQLPKRTPKRVEAFEGDVGELAARLRAELAGTGKDVWLGGGGLSLVPFHETGLVDRWELSVIPCLLGEGIPLFPSHRESLRALNLVRTKSLSNGIVSLDYAPAASSSR